MPDVHDYLAAFERGEEFTPPAEGLIDAGRPDPRALEALGDALASRPAAERESIVGLLVDVGLRSDPLTPRGAEALTNREIVSLLSGPGLEHADLGREAAMDALRKLGTVADLQPHGARYLEALESSPSDEAFLLVAKAKPDGAADVVERLAQEPEWTDVESVRVARAATGDPGIEQELLQAARDAFAGSDGRAAAETVGPLAMAGTEATLTELATHLRTALEITVPGAFTKSVRLNVLEGLLYAYPDQPVLYPNNIQSDGDYAAAEEFCTRTLGVQYDGERPPFLTIMGEPTPMR